MDRSTDVGRSHIIRLASIGCSAMLWLGMVATPMTAAAAGNSHGRGAGTWVEDDFCGTGVSVQHAFTETFTEHFGNVYRFDHEGQDVLTNPATGDSVAASDAGLLTGQFSGGDPDGVHTLTFTHAGLPLKIQTSRGAVLVRDAGYVVSVVTFDGEEFIGDENVVRGPHPSLDDPGLFCQVTTEVLGIE
jgi:hypothetical protein